MRKCLECNKIPYYNFTGQARGIYCVTHKKDGMVNVINKTCLECNKIPYYNFTGQKHGIYCVTHKKDGMIDVKHKKCLDCSKQPIFNFAGQKHGIYCVTHKKDGMVDVKNKRCHSQWCDTYGNKKYRGYCLFCFMNLFPDEKVARNYKTKERAVVDFVKSNFPEFTWVCDKKIKDGCSKRRPDMLLDLGEYVIVIEIDENQHIDYDCSCENKRLMEISRDIGHRNCVFIRFNPDDYFNNNQNKITSCWGINKNGILSVKKTKQKEWEKRLNILKETIDYWTVNKTDKMVEVIQLFFDIS